LRWSLGAQSGDAPGGELLDLDGEVESPRAQRTAELPAHGLLQERDPIVHGHFGVIDALQAVVQLAGEAHEVEAATRRDLVQGQPPGVLEPAPPAAGIVEPEARGHAEARSQTRIGITMT